MDVRVAAGMSNFHERVELAIQQGKDDLAMNVFEALRRSKQNGEKRQSRADVIPLMICGRNDEATESLALLDGDHEL